MSKNNLLEKRHVRSETVAEEKQTESVLTDVDFNDLIADHNNKDVGNVTSLSVNTTEPLVYYQVRAYNSAGQSLNSNVIVVDVAVSAATPEQAGIKMYPNPANEMLNVSSAKGSIESITIRDITGKVVLQSQISFENASFNVSTLEPGLYTISFEKQGHLTIEKLLKL